MWSAWVISEEGFDVCVRFTRHGKRTLDDDNLPTAFKHIRDGVADAIGIDDGSARYTWEYAQVKSKEYKIE
jgi:crossover junction endodeoxyribonuclease RusA